MSFISTEILFVITLNSQYLCYLFFIANIGKIIITTINLAIIKLRFIILLFISPSHGEK